MPLQEDAGKEDASRLSTSPCRKRKDRVIYYRLLTFLYKARVNDHPFEVFSLANEIHEASSLTVKKSSHNSRLY